MSSSSKRRWRKETLDSASRTGDFHLFSRLHADVRNLTVVSNIRMDVEKGKIEDTGGSGGSYSIKTQFNSEEQWTKALKFMLTNLKWGLAWVTSQFYNR